MYKTFIPGIIMPPELARLCVFGQDIVLQSRKSLPHTVCDMAPINELPNGSLIHIYGSCLHAYVSQSRKNEV